MQIFRYFRHSTEQTPCAVAIGNFDGVHLGHQRLLQQLQAFARSQGLQSAVMTFEPHPREFFALRYGRDDVPARLTSLREKLEHFARIGVDRVYVCRFDQPLSELSSAGFMQDILDHALQARAVLVGEDFRFGLKRQGQVQDLRDYGFILPEVRAEILAGERISSTRVRDALRTGELGWAKQLLGRDYSISGKVVMGRQLGRTLGFPTANIHMRHERPALGGVYAVKLAGLDAVANLGIRPTLDGASRLTLEVHVLDFKGDLYGQHVHVEFFQKIREEQKFADLASLQAQIAQDALTARKILKYTK
jgi:riboflavin kinase/FMN adenylyltransferase